MDSSFRRKPVSIGVLCDLLVRRLAAACLLKWPIRLRNWLASHKLAAILLIIFIGITYLGQIPILYGSGPDYLGSAPPGPKNLALQSESKLSTEDQTEEFSTVLPPDRLTWRTIVALYKASGLVGGTRRIGTLIGNPFKWFSRSNNRKRAYIEQPCDPRLEPKALSTPKMKYQVTDTGFKTGFTGLCSDIDAFCLQEVADYGLWTCACPLSYYFSGWRKRCREMKAYHDGCVSNDECQAYDSNSFCDYAPVYRHESPYCSCKTGFLYDPSIMKCVSCGTMLGPGAEDNLVACPPAADESNRTDPLRMWLPVKIIGSAVLLVVLVILGIFYCGKLYRHAKNLTRRKSKKRSKNQAEQMSPTERTELAEQNNINLDYFVFNNQPDYHANYDQQSHVIPEHQHGGFHSIVHQANGLPMASLISPIVNHSHSHHAHSHNNLCNMNLNQNNHSNHNLMGNTIPNSSQLVTSQEHTHAQAPRQSIVSRTTSVTSQTSTQPPTYAEAIKNLSFDPEANPVLDLDDDLDLSDATLTDTDESEPDDEEDD